MELIRISGAKLKVMLDLADMEKFSLDSSDIDYEDAATRRAFREILEEVRVRIGFETAGEKILVQVFPSRDGGCEMFVTRLPDELPAPLQRRIPARSITMMSMRKTAYCFRSFPHLLSVCRALVRCGYDGPSALRADDGGWYLFLQERVCSGTPARMGEFCFLSEYAEPIWGAAMLACIEEHSRPVIEEDAVTRLYDLL